MLIAEAKTPEFVLNIAIPVVLTVVLLFPIAIID
jgi:hypothetical protein